MNRLVHRPREPFPQIFQLENNSNIQEIPAILQKGPRPFHKSSRSPILYLGFTLRPLDF
jgi:hypothetical protein